MEQRLERQLQPEPSPKCSIESAVQLRREADEGPARAASDSSLSTAERKTAALDYGGRSNRAEWRDQECQLWNGFEHRLKLETEIQTVRLPPLGRYPFTGCGPICDCVKAQDRCRRGADSLPHGARASLPVAHA